MASLDKKHAHFCANLVCVRMQTQSKRRNWPNFCKVTRAMKIFLCQCVPLKSPSISCGRHRSGGIYYYSWGVFCACSPAIALNCSGTPVSTDAPRWACLLGRDLSQGDYYTRRRTCVSRICTGVYVPLCEMPKKCDFQRYNCGDPKFTFWCLPAEG